MFVTFESLVLAALLGTAAAWPIKTVDLSGDGTLCDPSMEQYLHIEAYDYHDHPKLTMTWRQISAMCGVEELNPASWAATYDESAGDAGPTDELVQLSLLVCSPFGDYELELKLESYSDDGSAREQRTSWAVRNGSDEYGIWDTSTDHLAYNERYSPVTPYTYTWPLLASTGFYDTLRISSLPMIACDGVSPRETIYRGCYSDSEGNRTFSEATLVLPEKGIEGMTTKTCSKFCTGYEFFGTESGHECFCGNATDFATANMSDACGATYSDLCTGDPTKTCGGSSAISIYQRIDPDLLAVGYNVYGYVGCFADNQDMHAMEASTLYSNFVNMTNEVCQSHCEGLGYYYAGTQSGVECWCGESYGTYGEADSCDAPCPGDGNHICGGDEALSVYVV